MTQSREKSLEEVAKSSGRHIDSYQFLLEGLQYTVKTLNRNDKRRRHVKAAQLLKGLSEYATLKFGLLATTVFHEWGIKGSEDLGAMVYEMIDLGIMKRSKEDRLEDFLAAPDIYTQLQDCSSRLFTDTLPEQK